MGTYSRCIKCLNEIAREAGKLGLYKERAKQKKDSQTPEQKAQTKLRHQDWHLKTKYGITAKRYDEMLLSQDGRCATCRTSEPRTRSGRFCVDHNHITGATRELLCFTCNAALGLLQEDPTLARNLAKYIERHKGNSNGD
jgi:hypothetical protein